VDMGHKTARYGANVCSVRLICVMCALFRLSVYEEVKFVVLWSLNIHILQPVRDD